MKELIKKNIFLVIAVFIIIVCISYYFIRNYRASKVQYNSEAYIDNYVTVPRTYNVNEYTKLNISNENAVKIYFNDFKTLVMSDINEAYLKLNKEYREKKFPSIESFKNYLGSINFINSNIVKYSINSSMYKMYDNNNHMYIFKFDGVLQYEVYFDENTVEIR